MFSRQHFVKALPALVAGLGIVGFTNVAIAQSAKATFAYSSIISLPACNRTDAAGCTSTSDTDWKPILRQQIKTANQKDLFLDASLQCGIVTDTTVKSQLGSLDSSEARATIRVRIKLTAANGTVTFAQPSGGADANNVASGTNDGIVFCDRVQTLRARFSGLNCTADATGLVTCVSPTELQLILNTLNANSFNFVAPNLSSGVYAIEVQARTSAATSVTGTNGSLGGANAFIGAGSVAVESVRMVKGNDGTTLPLD